jgi:hypothetical protein
MQCTLTKSSLGPFYGSFEKTNLPKICRLFIQNLPSRVHFSSAPNCTTRSKMQAASIYNRARYCGNNYLPTPASYDPLFRGLRTVPTPAPQDMPAQPYKRPRVAPLHPPEEPLRLKSADHAEKEAVLQPE